MGSRGRDGLLLCQTQSRAREIAWRCQGNFSCRNPHRFLQVPVSPACPAGVISSLVGQGSCDLSHLLIQAQHLEAFGRAWAGGPPPTEGLQFPGSGSRQAGCVTHASLPREQDVSN